MKQKQWFIDKIEHANTLTDEEWFDFEKKLSNYLDYLSKDEQLFFSYHGKSGYGKKIAEEMHRRRYGHHEIKNSKLKEYINKMFHTSEMTDDELIQFRIELHEYLLSLPEKQRNEFAQLGYGEAFEMEYSARID